MLTEIIRELEAATAHPIPAVGVLRWMRSGDADVLGATYALLSNARHFQRIVPQLQFDEVFEFLLRYFVFCLTHDPKSQWANSRYSAGWDLVGWFTQLWDEHIDRKYLDAIKFKLKDLYTTGDAELKDCIEHAVLEHLFERQPIQNYFREWQSDPELRPAYEEAMLWVKGGGDSPLVRRPPE